MYSDFQTNPSTFTHLNHLLLRNVSLYANLCLSCDSLYSVFVYIQILRYTAFLLYEGDFIVYSCTVHIIPDLNSFVKK